MSRVVTLAAAALLVSGTAWAGEGALSLKDATSRGLERSATTRLSATGLARADAQDSLAFAALLPKLDASAYQTRRTANLRAQGINFPGLPALAGPFNTFDARLSLSQTIFDARALLAAKGAGLSVDIARAQDEVAKGQVISRVALAYIAVLRAEQGVAAAQADLQVATELQTLAEDQRKAGVASGVDVARAQTLVSQDEFALAQARAQQASAGIALQRLVLLPQGAELRLADGLALADEPLPEADAAVRKAFEQRQELTALSLRQKVREYERDAARARRLPTLGAFADYGRSANTPSENTENTYTIGAKVGLPLFSGGAISADIRSAESTVDEARIQFEDGQAQVEEDVGGAGALAARPAALGRAATAPRALAARSIPPARDRFAHGVGSNIEVVEAQAALSRARAGAIDALASAQVARANLSAALGEPESFHLLPASEQSLQQSPE